VASSRNGANHRLYLLGGFLLFWFCVICLRLVYLQIFRYGDFQQRAEKQQQRAVNVSAKRGVIYDRKGNELAMSILVDSAFAVPVKFPRLPNAIASSPVSAAATRAWCWPTAARTRPSAGWGAKLTPTSSTGFAL
jgi:cell division protein FtsI/penicillin-binding protein 2